MAPGSGALTVNPSLIFDNGIPLSITEGLSLARILGGDRRHTPTKGWLICPVAQQCTNNINRVECKSAFTSVFFWKNQYWP